MSEPTISCPTCNTAIKLTEQLAAPLIAATRRQYEQKMSQKEVEVARREAAIREQEAAVARAKAAIGEEVAQRIEAERESIAAAEAKKAKLLAAADIDEQAKQIADLREVLRERDAKLAEAQKVQAELVRKERALDDARRELDLTVEKRVRGELVAVREKARQEAEEGLKLKVAEKEEQIASMQRQIEDLKRKAEQTSQQLQGEVQELELEAMLRVKFPFDSIEPVAKGEFGGDVLHRIVNAQGQSCGAILWEAKRTRNWSDAWLAKLRDDQRAARADFALIMSQALPKGVTGFDLIEGVWVTEFRCAIPVAIALRQSLLALTAARQTREGQETKMELVYQYLTGPRFRHRIDAIVEKFSDMQEDLERERKTMTRLWAKREAQIRGAVESTFGMYGDLQGIAGRSLAELDGPGMRLLGTPAEADDEIPSKVA